jgi:uncharacterized iron-regulated membrane protein
MRLRKVFVRGHRWLGFALLAWLIVICSTGAWLVFNQGLDARLHAARYDHSSGDVGPSRALAGARRALPAQATVYYVARPTNARGVYTVNYGYPSAHDAAEEERYGTIFVDPGTGTVNGGKLDDEGFTHWMYRGHMYLWQDHGIFGVFHPKSGWCRPDSKGAEPGGAQGVVCDVIPDGSDMVAWFATGWIVVLLTGFYLWYWPGVRRWATALVIKRGRGAFAANMSVHKVVGLVVFVPLLVIAFTGIAFAFPNLKAWYENVTPAQRGQELWVAPESAVSDPKGSRVSLDADDALATMQRRFPDRRIEGIVPPDGKKGTWSAWATRGYDPWTREGYKGDVYIVIDRYSGELLYDGTPEEGNVLDQVWSNWSFPVHAGDFGGTATRSIWVVIALSPFVLGTTGVTMWLIRRSKRRRHLRPSATTAS